MANIKLFGNTKIQGKAFFNIQEETVPFSPDQITGLRSWYDVAEGVYGTNGIDSTSDEYASVSFSENRSGTSQAIPDYSLFNGKKSYRSNSLRWENNAWTLTYEVGYSAEDGEYYNTITASGDTQYPWQANWSGSGNNVTKAATSYSTPASLNGTVVKWKNKRFHRLFRNEI
jgi:hypothetical protein